MYLSKNAVFFIALIIGVLGSTNKSLANLLMPAEEEYFIVTDKAAAPVGGIDALVKKVLAESPLKGKGKLYLLVYVNDSGEVDEVKIVKGIGGNESKAVDIVEKTKFTPGMNNNAPVKSKVALALNFN